MMLVAACLKNQEPFQQTVRCDLPENKQRIIVIDTEQSKYHVWKRLNIVARLVGPIDLARVEVYSFREFTPSQRVELIERLAVTANTEQSIGLIIVDGIRDCVHDINDPKEATHIVTKLMQWTTLANCHIVTVLHQNKADQNARGHVGTELVNKAESVMSVTVQKDDKNVSIIEAEGIRDDREFTPFAFSVSDEGIPTINCEMEVATSNKEKIKGFDYYNMPPETHHRILRAIFKSGNGLSRPDLMIEVKVAWKALSQNFGNNVAGELIAYYVKQEWIRNESSPGKKAEYKYVLGLPRLG